MAQGLNEIYTIECTNMAFEPDPVKVMYVENHYDWYMNQFVFCHMEKFTKAFETLGYEFCYIPQMLNSEVQNSNDQHCLAILNGEADDVPESFKVAYCARQIVRAQGDMKPSLCKFSHCESGRAVFFCLELDDNLDNSLVLQFYDFISSVRDLDHKRLEMSGQGADEDRVDNYELVEAEEIVDEENAEDGVAADLELLRIISERLRSKGIAEERIKNAVEPQKKLSRLHVTRDNRILLPDYNNAEVELDPLHKAVFLLFLKHPDGIRLKEVSDYRNELMSLYIDISKKDSHDDKAKKHINDICSPLKNSIHEKCSRIRKSLNKIIGDEDMLSHYCIAGKRGEPKAIDLPRTMVVWD